MGRLQVPKMFKWLELYKKMIEKRKVPCHYSHLKMQDTCLDLSEPLCNKRRKIPNNNVEVLLSRNHS